MPAPELTIEGLLQRRYRLFFGPLGQVTSLGVAMQGVVFLDPRERSPLARTLMHELIHVARPTWTEHHVRQEERRLWLAATWKQKAKLYAALGKGKVWEGEEDFPDDASGDGPVRVEHAGHESAQHPRTDQDVHAPQATGLHDPVGREDHRLPAQSALVPEVRGGGESR